MIGSYFVSVLFLQNFSVRSLDLFSRFLFTETLELLDIDWYGPGDQNSCKRVHVMPRYARPLPGKFRNDVSIYMEQITSAEDIFRYIIFTSSRRRVTT